MKPGGLGRLADRAGYLALLGLGLLVFGFPLYWMVRGAFITQATWLKVPTVWLPREFTAQAFSDIFAQFRMSRVLLNTLALATATMIANVLFDSLAGFAFAKMRVPFKEWIFLTLLVTLMVPFEGLMVPLYLIVTKAGLANTMVGLVLPGAASAFCIYLMRQFFSKVPDDLIEAAVVDGAGWLRVFFSVAAPLAAPAVATVAVITFLAGWESFIWPLLITDPHSKFDVLQKVIAQAAYTSMQGTSAGIEFPWLMAAALLSTLPVLVLFAFFQRYFIAGLTAGAVKG
jgi:multiple sugar transport system permease protein